MIERCTMGGRRGGKTVAAAEARDAAIAQNKRVLLMDRNGHTCQVVPFKAKKL